MGADAAVDDRVRPLAVEVEVVAGGVEVPGTDAGRAAADLGELQSLRTEEPLHVGRAGADPERLDDPLAHLTHLPVVRHRVDPVGGDVLRGDPAGPHRLEHVGEVVAREVGRRPSVDGQGVVEPLVALDVLLDRDRADTLVAEVRQHVAELLLVVHPGGVGSAGTAAWLEDQREPDGAREVLDLLDVVGRGRRGGRHADGAERVLHRRLVAAQPGGAHRRPGDGARLAHLGDGHDVRLDGGLQPVHPHVVLDPPHRVGHRADVDDAAHPVVVPHPAPELVVEHLLRRLADADHLGADRGQCPDELALVPGKVRFYEDHAHASHPNRTFRHASVARWVHATRSGPSCRPCARTSNAWSASRRSPQIQRRGPTWRRARRRWPGSSAGPG